MISKDYNKVDQEVEVRLGNLEIATATIRRDVTHLTDSIDNHIASAIREVDSMLDRMGPKVDECHKWINRIQIYVVWPAAGTVVTGGILAFLRYVLGVI